MTTLRDPFAITHKKDIKNKAGQVVAQVDYVGWSQVADRLDEVEPGWSFIVIALGEDWCHGRLTFNDRTFENVGYAENADMDWKKEALKDAVSDAFKRCAALAGVARYLYDKDSPSGQAPAPRPAPRPVAAQPPLAATGADEPPFPGFESDPGPSQAARQDAAARCSRSRTPSHSASAGGSSTQINCTPRESKSRSVANNSWAAASGRKGMRW